jgi:hypothetical protein
LQCKIVVSYKVVKPVGKVEKWWGFFVIRRSGLVSAAAFAIIMSAGNARADDPPSLRELLSTVPQAALDAEGFPLAAAVDLATARRLLPEGSSAMTRGLMLRLSGGSSIRPFREWRLYYRTEQWEKEVAVASSEIDAFVGYGGSPGGTAIWFFRNEAGARTVFDDLSRRGFTAIEDGMIANGEPGKLDIKRRRPGDPWRGELGKTSVVARDGRMLFQAAEPKDVATVRTAATSNVTTHPAVDAVLRGAEALSKDGVRIVQAFLSSPTIGFDASMPMTVQESKTVDELRKKVEEKAARDRSTGLPPYAMVLIADIDMPGTGHGVAVVFAYRGCAQAEEGGKRFIHRWNTIPTHRGKTLAELAPVEAAARTVPGTHELCASVVTLTSRTPMTGDNLANRPWDVIFGAIMSRDFVAATMATGGK